MDSPSTPPPAPSAPAADFSNDKIFAILCHISPLFGLGLILPLVIYLVKKDESPTVASEAKEALNFHISAYLAMLCCIPLTFILIGVPLIFGIGLAVFVFALIATIKAVDGKPYVYPYTLRLVK